MADEYPVLMKLKLTSLVAIILFLAAAFFLATHHPAQTIFVPRCPLHQLTGLHCSGCGSLRCIHYLLTGHFAEAWAMNPLTLLTVPLVTVLAISELFFHQCDFGNRVRPHFIWALLAVYILFGIARNLPIRPFNTLAPHSISEKTYLYVAPKNGLFIGVFALPEN